MEANPSEDFLPADAKGVPHEVASQVVFMDDVIEGRIPMQRISGLSAIETVYDGPGVRISGGKIVGAIPAGQGRPALKQEYRNAEEFMRNEWPEHNCSCGSKCEYINPKVVRCVRCGQKYER